MKPPETRYAKSGDVHVAYQVSGSGPRDLVLVPGFVSNLELFWEEPSVARWLNRLGSFSRLIRFDKRGTGLSDRVTDTPTLEVRMDDMRAVMDAAGSECAVVAGYSEGGPMSALFAATHPSRASALIMMGGFPRWLKDAEYPWAPSREEHDHNIARTERDWGGPVGIEMSHPADRPTKAIATGGRAAFAQAQVLPRPLQYCA